MSEKNLDNMNISFEDAMNRLEQIASQLEQGGVSLEQSLLLYEEGSRLAAFCSGTLKAAQRRITEISAENDASAQM